MKAKLYSSVHVKAARTARLYCFKSILVSLNTMVVISADTVDGSRHIVMRRDLSLHA